MDRISELEEFIAEELEGARNYVSMALKYKTIDQKLADNFYAMAKAQLEHAMALHSHANRISDELKIDNNNVLWDWYHDKQMQKRAQILAMIGMYK